MLFNQPPVDGHKASSDFLLLQIMLQEWPYIYIYVVLHMCKDICKDGIADSMGMCKYF